MVKTKTVNQRQYLELFSWKTTSNKYHLLVWLPISRLLSGLHLYGMWSSMTIALMLYSPYIHTLDSNSVCDNATALSLSQGSLACLSSRHTHSQHCSTTFIQKKSYRISTMCFSWLEPIAEWMNLYLLS